jgi:hypothetical protein
MTILGRLALQNALSQNAQSRSQMTFYEFISFRCERIDSRVESNIQNASIVA